MQTEKLRILKEIFGDHYKVSEEYLFHCPRCKHHKKKLSINISKNCFKCWICDYSGKSIFRLVRKYGHFSHKLKWESFESTIDLSTNTVENAFLDKEEEYFKVDLPEEFKSICNRGSKFENFSTLRAKRYLKSRGLNKEDILKWKLGCCVSGKYEGRVIIPSFDERGNVNYFVARTYEGDYIKYKNVSASKDIVFNELYIDWDSDVVLVEGVFDAFKAGNAVPLLGSSLREDSKLVNKIVKYDTPIYMALDTDVKKKTLSFMKNLLQYDIELYQVDIGDNKDVGEMTKEEFLRAKKDAPPVTFDNYLKFLL